MSNQKAYNLSKKAATGAALVALSGFVPQPMMQSANAASAAINVSGSFVTGVTLTPGVAVNFGKLLATAATGNITLSTAGVLSGSVGVKKVGALAANGSIKATIANKTAAMNVTIKGLGPVVLAATVNGAGPAGTAKLTKILMKGAALNTLRTVTAVGTTGKTTVTAAVTTPAAVIALGGRLDWTGAIPLGSFTQAITVIMAF